MTIALIILAVLLVFTAGGAFILFATIQYTIKRTLMGRPLLVTIPGNRPGTSTTYQVTSRGWRRVTPRAHVQNRVSKALDRLKRARARASTLGAKHVAPEPELAEPVSQEQDS